MFWDNADEEQIPFDQLRGERDEERAEHERTSGRIGETCRQERQGDGADGQQNSTQHEAAGEHGR